MRDVTVSTTLGHCIGFTAGKAVEVPEAAVPACAAKGCMPAEDFQKVLSEATSAPEPTKDNKQEVLVEAIESMVARNAVGDFTADKLPNTKVLAKETGLNVSVKERNEAWEIVQKGLGE